MHPARGLEGAGQGLQPRRRRRLHRRRSHVRLPARQGAAVPHARRREPGSAARRARSVRSWATVNTPRRSARWASAAGVSLIGCKIGALNRLPASFFVSVAYDCWAFRRLGVVLDAHDRRDHAAGCIAIRRVADRPDARPGRLPAHGPRDRAARRRSTEDAVRALKVGDVVLISGRMFTGRDAVHSHLMKHEPPVDLRGAVLYHCGPVVVKDRRRLARHRRRPDDEHPRGAVPGRDHQALRRARGDRQGRHGREDAGRR